MAWFNPSSWFTGSGNTRKKGSQNENPDRYPSESAATVTFDSAMTVSAFWASSRLLTEAMASMPIRCYKREADGSRSIATNYRLWRTLNYTPNRYQTRTEFLESLMLNLVTSGNAYIYVDKNKTNFMPLMSAQMDVKLSVGGVKSYEYKQLNGMKSTYKEADIWHIKLFGNGIIGMSPLGFARQSLGISIAADSRIGKLAKNGGKTSGLLTSEAVLTDVQRGQLRKNMQDIAAGDTDTLKILEAGLKYQQINLSPQDMQLLESRRFQLEDVARFMGVPSVLINDTAGSTVWGSGVQQIISGFYKLNLRPYAERIESSLKRFIMPPGDWDNYDIEFDFDSLLRPDRETRIKTNGTAINSGQMTPNEARNDEGKPDKEGGDEIYLNGSLVPAGQEKEPPTTDHRVQQLEDKQNEDN